jgi:hypothetical protein
MNRYVVVASCKQNSNVSMINPSPTLFRITLAIRRLSYFSFSITFFVSSDTEWRNIDFSTTFFYKYAKIFLHKGSSLVFVAAGL